MKFINNEVWRDRSPSDDVPWSTDIDLGPLSCLCADLAVLAASGDPEAHQEKIAIEVGRLIAGLSQDKYAVSWKIGIELEAFDWATGRDGPPDRVLAALRLAYAHLRGDWVAWLNLQPEGPGVYWVSAKEWRAIVGSERFS